MLRSTEGYDPVLRGFSLGRLRVKKVMSHWVVFFDKYYNLWALRANCVNRAEPMHFDLDDKYDDCDDELEPEDQKYVAAVVEEYKDLFDQDSCCNARFYG